MINTFLKYLYILVGPCIVSLLLLLPGCYFQKRDVSKQTIISPSIEKMVVIGFRPAMLIGDKPGMIRSPLSGAVYMAEPVSWDVVNKMTANLFSRLLEDKSYDLISPSQAKGVFSSIVSSNLVLGDIEISLRIGEAFSADAILMGYIYRWREREGTDYAVNRPASVAFDLYLVRTGDGSILRKGKFDKSQRSLSENLLDMDTFLKGGGRWMTAEKLAALGLVDLLKKLPKGEREQE